MNGRLRREDRLPHGGGVLQPASLTLRAEQEKPGGVALVCGFKYLASEKSREPVGGDCAQALATCPDSAVAIKIGNTEMETAIAIDNDSLRMGEATRTLTGDHESRVTDTGTSIVQTFTKTGHAKDATCAGEKYSSSSSYSSSTLNTFENHTEGRAVDLVVALEGNGSRPSHFGDGYSAEGVGYTLNHVEHHAVAVRTANTHANGHGVADEATHTLDLAQGQAIAVGFKPGQSGRKDTGSLGAQPEQSPTLPRDPGGMGIGVAIGCDRRNQTGSTEVQPALQSSVSDGGSTVAVATGFSHSNSDISVQTKPTPECCMTLRSAATGTDGNDADPKICTGVDLYNQAETGDVSKPLNSAATDSDHIPVARLSHIVRRLTPGECESLQAFPQGWTQIPYRGKPAEECPDSPRYRALGNSWATNCAEWILRRIVAAIRLDLIPLDEPLS